jgi:hypothetical protein
MKRKLSAALAVTALAAAAPSAAFAAQGLFELPIPGAAASGSNVLAFRNMVRRQALRPSVRTGRGQSDGRTSHRAGQAESRLRLQQGYAALVLHSRRIRTEPNRGSGWTMDEMAGSRREEYEAALRQAGITRQTVWHQETPDGTVAVVLVEGDDPEAGIAQFGSSDEPLNAWFREQMKEVHGVDISEAQPQATKVHDIQL